MGAKLIKSSFFALISGTLLSACMSTEVIEPKESSQEVNEIVLSIKTPQEVLTRADNGYKLRYIAKIIKGSNTSAWGNTTPLDRQEIIDGESNNQIIFKVPAGENYGILVFADYIPADYQRGTNGLYKDHFYNTTNSSKVAIIRTTPGSDKETVSADFFNNDNYDAFYGIKTLRKEIEEVVVDMTLVRTTAKVIFRENTNTGTGNITLTKLGVQRQFYLDSGTCAFASSTSINVALPNASVVDDDNKDLFFFYTLADTPSPNQTVSTEFKVINNAISSDPFTITKIPVKANYKTIVTSAFLSEEETPKEDETKAGDIILNLSANYDWEQEEFTINY